MGQHLRESLAIVQDIALGLQTGICAPKSAYVRLLEKDQWHRIMDLLVFAAESKYEVSLLFRIDLGMIRGGC